MDVISRIYFVEFFVSFEIRYWPLPFALLTTVGCTQESSPPNPASNRPPAASLMASDVLEVEHVFGTLTPSTFVKSLESVTGADPAAFVLSGVIERTDEGRNIALISAGGQTASPTQVGDWISDQGMLVSVKRYEATIRLKSGETKTLVLGAHAPQTASSAHVPVYVRPTPPVPTVMPDQKMLERANAEFQLPAND